MSQSTELYRPGLEGIIAGETHVSTVEQDSLAYFGYPIEQLAEHASFEEVAYLLLHGALPLRGQLAEFRARLDHYRALPREVVATLRSIPKHVGGMDVLRTAVSMLGHFDVVQGTDRAALIERAIHILAAAPSIIAARMRLLDDKEPLEPRPGLSHAGQFFHLAFGRDADPLDEKVLNLTLVLYAEHEFNASTFTARVCASTLSDMYSCIVAGIGALKGPLHGGANEESIKLINQFRSGEEARTWALSAVERKELIMGFGHRVYKNGDHRARILQPYMEQLGRLRGQEWKLDVYRAIRDVVWEKKQIHMNVDYPCGLTYYYMNLPIEMYTPLFVASRVSGWAAHVIEQLTNNRIIRPRSRYVGPTLRSYVPIDQR